MKSKYVTIILDLDGTILDTSRGIMNSVQYVIDKMNLVQLDEETKKCFVGPKVIDSFQKYCNLEHVEATKATQLYREYYWKHGMYQAEVYKGIVELLDWLKSEGFKVGVATLKAEDQAVEILRYFKLLDKFDIVSGVNDKNINTKKDCIIRVADSLNENDPEKMLMIGDSIFDYEGAMLAGVDFIGVKYGFGFNDNSQDLKITLCENVNEVKKLIYSL